MITNFGSKRSVKKFLIDSKILKLLSCLKSNVVVLRYHSIKETPENYWHLFGKGTVNSFSVFKDQMEILAKNFNPITMDDIVSFLSREKSLPKKSVIVTFDDGYLDNYELAYPILNQFGIKATFYVQTDLIETNNIPWFIRIRNAFTNTRKDKWLDIKENQFYPIKSVKQKELALLNACIGCSGLIGEAQERLVTAIEVGLDVEPLALKNGLIMNWDQIKRLHDDGHIIGSHTVSHPNMALINEEEVKHELLQSKNILEKQINSQVNHFCYPNPSIRPIWTKETRSAVQAAGYQTAVITTGGNIGVGNDPYSLKRIWVPNEIAEFRWDLFNTILGRLI